MLTLSLCDRILQDDIMPLLYDQVLLKGTTADSVMGNNDESSEIYFRARLLSDPAHQHVLSL